MRWKVTFVAGALLGAALASAVLMPGCGTNCTPANCPVGCCDAHGTCQVGNTNTACGAHGQVCATCTLEQDCLLGTCDDIGGGCSQATCPNGCCDGSQCLASCPTGFVCSNHACVNPTGDGGACDPSNCSGCCVGGTCILPAVQSVAACGLNGVICATCAFGDVCQNGFCSGGGGCGAATCAGCCVGSFCLGVGQQSVNQCGNAGEVCAACPTGDACLMGTCSGGPSCGPMSCPGCCDLSGVCQLSETISACGNAGTFCVTCFPSQVCNAGFCTSPGDGGVRPGDSCATPFILKLVNGTASANGTTFGFNDDSAGQCGGTLAPDVVYQFTVPTTFNFSVALQNGTPSWTPVVYLRDWAQCATSAQIDCAAAFGPGLNVVMGSNGLDAGTYALWIDGLSVPDAGSSGAYSIAVTAM